MLDAKSIRENPAQVKEAMQRRGSSWSVDEFLDLDAERRRLIAETEALQAERNAASKEIGALMQQGKADEAESRKARVREINEHVAALDAEADQCEQQARRIRKPLDERQTSDDRQTICTANIKVVCERRTQKCERVADSMWDNLPADSDVC